jgi:hypothetical protein
MTTITLTADDDRLAALPGVYKIPFDARPTLRALNADPTDRAAWEVLWNELHHQGDVAGASYAAVVLLLRAGRPARRQNMASQATVPSGDVDSAGGDAAVEAPQAWPSR